MSQSSLIQQIHATDITFELVITGGGSSALSALLAEPGASRSLLNGCVPYSSEALRDYLGSEPESACSEATARIMATQAFHRALSYQSGNVLGVAATAALQTDRTRRGQDRIYVAVQCIESLSSYYLNLDDLTKRSEQETACQEFILGCIARHMDIPTAKSITATESAAAPKAWQELLFGNAHSSATQAVAAILPGAFNPPHEGHLLMQQISERKLGCDVSFELSIENVDKPKLDYIDMAKRQAQLSGKSLVFSRAATFVEKSGVFPGATFVVGIDTLVRIDDKKYYGNSEAKKKDAIHLLHARGHRFLVFGRLTGSEFLGLKDLDLTPELLELCTEVPESEFRVDLSSTELRAQSN